MANPRESRREPQRAPPQDLKTNHLQMQVLPSHLKDQLPREALRRALAAEREPKREEPERALPRRVEREAPRNERSYE